MSPAPERLHWRRAPNRNRAPTAVDAERYPEERTMRRKTPDDRPPPADFGRKATERTKTARTGNPQLAAQTRKLLAKHWANKHRHGRG
jgi:hypothetical protein